MPKKRLIILLILSIGLAITIYTWWIDDRVRTDDAYIDGHIHLITPRVAGYVTKVEVADNQEVKLNQPLLQLDHTEFDLALAEEIARLAETEATLAALQIGVPLESDQTALRVSGTRAQLESLDRIFEKTAKEEEAAAQEIQCATAENEQAALDLGRLERLAQTKVVSQSDVDRAHTIAETSTAQMRSAKAKLEGIQKFKASITADMDRIKAEIGLAATGKQQVSIKAHYVESQRARVELAQAKVHKAKLELSWTVITSPINGFITKKRVESGQHVTKGQPLLAVVPLAPEELWITANYKETQLAKVHPGQFVDVKVDTYPNLRLTGIVDSLMAGTGATFSLFPPENASGNFVKVVQRIPVKIKLPPEKNPKIPHLWLGMSVVPTIHTDE